MIIEYKELVQHDDEATRLKDSQTLTAGQKSESQATAKRRTYSSLVHLESQCKITHYELNNQALGLKDAYVQMTEAIEEQERFKAGIVEKLTDLSVKQAKIMLNAIKSFFTDVTSVEK